MKRIMLIGLVSLIGVAQAVSTQAPRRRSMPNTDECRPCPDRTERRECRVPMPCQSEPCPCPERSEPSPESAECTMPEPCRKMCVTFEMTCDTPENMCWREMVQDMFALMRKCQECPREAAVDMVDVVCRKIMDTAHRMNTSPEPDMHGSMSMSMSQE